MNRMLRERYAELREAGPLEFGGCCRAILNYQNLLRRLVNRCGFLVANDIVVTSEAVGFVCNSNGVNYNVHVGSERHALICPQRRPLHQVIPLAVPEEPSLGAKALADHELVMRLEH